MNTPTDEHPSQYSPEVLRAMTPVLARLNMAVHDPFAGTGVRLGQLCDRLGLTFTGAEIEPEFIVDPRVRHADSTWPGSYPDQPYIICCLAHGQRVLTADLRWVDVADVDVGDELLTTQEDPGRKVNGALRRRDYEFATVTHSTPAEAECVEVILADGASVITTLDHPWLARPYAYQGGDWVRSGELLDSFDPHVARAFTPWARTSTYEAGWLAGMFDGEGWLGFGKRHQQLAIVQRPGPIQDRIERLLFEVTGAKFNTWITKRDRPTHQTYVQGGMAEVLRVLGELRPERLIADLRCKEWSATIQPEWVRVVDVRPAGTRWIQSLTTTSGTYIGEGFVMHNTSPVYPNGMADHFKASTPEGRHTYRQAIHRLTGADRELARANMGRYSVRRGMASFQIYAELADAAVAWWYPSVVVLNVSDFYVGDEVFELVKHWRALLKARGYQLVADQMVRTRRQRRGEYGDRRVDHEWIITAFPRENFNPDIFRVAQVHIVNAMDHLIDLVGV